MSTQARPLMTQVVLDFRGEVTIEEVVSRLRDVAAEIEANPPQGNDARAGRHDTARADRPWWWTFGRWV